MSFHVLIFLAIVSQAFSANPNCQNATFNEKTVIRCDKIDLTKAVCDNITKGDDEKVGVFELWFSEVKEVFPLSEKFKNIKRIVFIGVNLKNEENSLKTLSQGLSLEDLKVSRSNFEWKVVKKSTFTGIETIKSLDLHKNKIMEVEADAFSALTKLKVIKLHQNFLTSLPEGLFEKNSNLKEINLSENQLKIIPANVFNSVKTASIDLTGNCCIDGKNSLENLRKDLTKCREIVKITTETPEKADEPDTVDEIVKPDVAEVKPAEESKSVYKHFIFKAFFGHWTF